MCVNFGPQCTQSVRLFWSRVISFPDSRVRGRAEGGQHVAPRGKFSSQTKIYNQLKMCSSCETLLIQLSVPIWAQRHIIHRHYPRTGYVEIERKRSLFYKDAMPSHVLFTTVVNELRSGLQDYYIQRKRIRGRRIVRYVYYYTFGFAIGTCPNRQGGFRETETIKIVCNVTECRECNRRCAREVVTIFPVEDYGN